MTTRNRELASIIDDSGNITTGGNLSVTGNLTQSSSTTTTYSDGLLELNTGAGSNSNDLGLVMERGSTGDNAIFLWDESNDGFAVGTTTATGSATGNISFSAAPFTASTITGTILNGSTSVRTPLIEYTDGDDALTIADGGAVTTSQNFSIGGSNNELRFYEGSNYVGFEAPALSADKIWVLPAADGSSGQLLKTDGSGNLSFTDDLTLANASVNNYSGDGSTTGFTLSTTPVSENATQVYINGVYQFKNTYAVSGTTLTFDTAPANGSSIEALVWSTVAINVPADASVTNAKLNASIITGQSEVTAADADHVLIYDASSSALKKTLVSDLLQTSEEIQDIVGAMFSSNTETGITATYQDGDGTIDLVLDVAQTNITSVGTLTALTLSGNLDLQDNDKILLGSGDDLELFHDGSDSYIKDTGTGNLLIQGSDIYMGDTSSNHAFVIRASGNVGIGTTSPSTKLHLGGTAPGDSIIRQDSTGSGTNWEIGERSAGKWQIFEDDNDSIVATFQSTGNVGIGTTSPSAPVHIQTNNSETNDSVTGLMITTLSTGTTTTNFGGAIQFQAERNNGVLQNTGLISSQADVNSGSDISSGLRFSTGTAGVLDEKMRLTYNGKLGIGTTNPTAGGLHLSMGNPNSTGDAHLLISKSGNNDWTSIFGVGSDDYGLLIQQVGSYMIAVKHHGDGNYEFRVDSNGAIFATDTSVNSISDRRLKENIVDAKSQWDDIKALKWRNFNWNEASGRSRNNTLLGLIADEVESVSPNLVGIDAQPKEDIVAGIEDPEYKNVKYSIVWMKAMKALQEAMTRIEALEAEVAALKG